MNEFYFLVIFVANVGVTVIPEAYPTETECTMRLIEVRQQSGAGGALCVKAPSTYEEHHR